MTIPVKNSRRVINALGTTLATLTHDFMLENATHLQVWADEQRLILGVHYSISGIGNPAGYTVTITDPDDWTPQRWVLQVSYPINQPSDVDVGGQFGERFEAALDRLGRGQQTLKDLGRRALKMVLTTPVDVEIEVEEGTPNHILGWNDTARRVVSVDPATLGGGGNGGDFVGFWTARYFPESQQRDLSPNELPLESGDWTRTAKQELADVFTGGNADGQLPRLAATDIGTCIIKPPTEEETNFVYATTPWMQMPEDGFFYRLVPVDIATVLHNTPVSPPLFRPVETNGFGFLRWQYIGDEPMHVTLEGSMEMLVRVAVAAVPDYARARHILQLCAWNVPHLEDGQNRGHRHLAASATALDDAGLPITRYEDFNDPCAPVTAEVIAEMANSAPNLYTGSDNGFIHNNPDPGWTVDPVTGLLLSDQLGPVGSEVQTTEWIDVSGIDKQTRAFAMTFDGTSFRRRIQYRVSGDPTAHYFFGQSWNVSAYSVFRLPIEATEFRVYYTGRDATAGDNNVDIRALTSQAVSAQHDPLKGLFHRRQFSVNRDVVFYPGGIYGLNILTLVANGGSAREWGFRYISGGFNFKFDAGRMRKKLLKNLYTV